MRPDIVTVTLNPAIDQTVFLEHLRPGRVNRAVHLERHAGGKGVNVSAMLGAYGIPSTATGFLGRENPQLFEKLFMERSIRDEFIRIDGETRIGIKIVDESTLETTDLNFPGLEPNAADLCALEEKLRVLASPGRWFVVAGSLSAGVSIGFFESLLRLLKQSGANIAVDTSGAALQAAIRCGADVIKPNHHELAEILGRDLPDISSRVAAVLRLQRDGVPHVILSLGSEGALFAGPEGMLLAGPPPAMVSSSVGAGDAMLAGYLAGLVQEMSAAGRTKLASVFAWSALEDAGRKSPSPAETQERLCQIEICPL